MTVHFDLCTYILLTIWHSQMVIFLKSNYLVIFIRGDTVESAE